MQELITYAGDRRLVLSNGEGVRELVYGSSWTKIRIGLQLSLVGMTGTLVGPVLALGVCSGPNGYGVPSTTNVAGVKLSGTNNPTFAAGPPAYATTSSTNVQAFKRVGTVLTTTLASLVVSKFGIEDATSLRTGFFVEIQKGSPNYTFVLAGPASAAVPSEMTDTEFEQIMDLPLLTDADLVKSNYVSTTASSITLAVDEVAGAFDHLFVYWNRTTVKLSFNIKHRMVA